MDYRLLGLMIGDTGIEFLRMSPGVSFSIAFVFCLVDAGIFPPFFVLLQVEFVRFLMYLRSAKLIELLRISLSV